MRALCGGSRFGAKDVMPYLLLIFEREGCLVVVRADFGAVVQDDVSAE